MRYTFKSLLCSMNRKKLTIIKCKCELNVQSCVITEAQPNSQTRIRQLWKFEESAKIIIFFNLDTIDTYDTPPPPHINGYRICIKSNILLYNV